MLTTNLASPTLACRRCGGDVPAGPLAAAAGAMGAAGGPSARLVLDRQCPHCHHRALYRTSELRLAP